MKTYKKIECTVEDKTFCNICKEEIIKEQFEYTDIKLVASMGSIYPGESFITRFDLDFCRECLITKVVPLLTENFDIKFSVKQDGEILEEDEVSIDEFLSNN